MKAVNGLQTSPQPLGQQSAQLHLRIEISQLCGLAVPPERLHVVPLGRYPVMIGARDLCQEPGMARFTIPFHVPVVLRAEEFFDAEIAPADLRLDRKHGSALVVLAVIGLYLSQPEC
ncbi:MAG: hypothetical protein JXR37_29735 [Kiritimatiellae bacterium]|nr:hypothetical protein [Kiritimatiellia bacterium]